jgi:hypothetical protein
MFGLLEPDGGSGRREFKGRRAVDQIKAERNLSIISIIGITGTSVTA